MQFQHSQEQLLKVSTVPPSMTLLPHQRPSLDHSVYRALEQGLNPSLVTPSAGGGFWGEGINKSKWKGVSKGSSG